MRMEQNRTGCIALRYPRWRKGEKETEATTHEEDDGGKEKACERGEKWEVKKEGRRERSEDSGKQKKREYCLESIVERGHCVRRSDLLSSVRRLGYVSAGVVRVCRLYTQRGTHTHTHIYTQVRTTYASRCRRAGRPSRVFPSTLYLLSCRWLYRRYYTGMRRCYLEMHAWKETCINDNESTWRSSRHCWLLFC